MNKAIFGLAIGVGLIAAAGETAGIYGYIEAAKEQKTLPEMVEVVKQDYLAGDKTLEEYNIKMQEYAKRDAELTDTKDSAIAISATCFVLLGFSAFTAYGEKVL